METGSSAFSAAEIGGPSGVKGSCSPRLWRGGACGREAPPDLQISESRDIGSVDMGTPL